MDRGINLPGDCARACCASDNCTMWTYFNGTTDKNAVQHEGWMGGKNASNNFRVKDACVLGFVS